MDTETDTSLKQLADTANAYLRRGRVKHNYNAPKYGMYAAQILIAWAKEGYRPLTISCHTLRITPTTLRLQLQQGIAWNIENATDMATREKFEYLQAITVYSNQHNSLILTKRGRVLEAVSYEVDLDKLRQRADFKNWINSNPPNLSVWPPEPFKRIELDDVEFYRDEMAKLDAEHAGYVAIIKPDNIKFMRHTVT